MAASRPLLALRGISKHFPGVKALDNVDLDLHAGEVHALMGENGAGKSTLVKLLSGVYRPSAGEILVEGASVVIESPSHAGALGISPVHQELHLEPHLSVAENIFLGRQPVGRLGMVRHRAMRRQAAAVLARLGISLDPGVPVGRLSIAQRQVVAIARAVSTMSRILILDEPTSSLTEREAVALFETIRRLRAEGLSILYISHRMDEVFQLTDRTTVLRDGRQVGSCATSALDLRSLITMMVGRDLGDLFCKVPGAIGGTALEVRRLSSPGVLHDISLTLRQGEIVGLAGLVGAGRTELARAIFGDLPIAGGEVLVSGKPLPRRHSPKDAIAAGIALVPEDRKEQGLVTALSVRENISMALLRSLCRAGFVDLAAERRLARDFVQRLDVRTPSVEQRVVNLSGGNQQRVVIAKWLATRPKVLIVDEPTRGIDVRATAEIHALLCELAREGLAILMISSDMPEILAMSDRILVMHQGRLAGELGSAEASQEAVLRLASGVRDDATSVAVVA